MVISIGNIVYSVALPFLAIFWIKFVVLQFRALNYRREWKKKTNGVYVLLGSGLHGFATWIVGLKEWFINITMKRRCNIFHEFPDGLKKLFGYFKLPEQIGIDGHNKNANNTRKFKWSIKDYFSLIL